MCRKFWSKMLKVWGLYWDNIKQPLQKSNGRMCLDNGKNFCRPLSAMSRISDFSKCPNFSLCLSNFKRSGIPTRMHSSWKAYTLTIELIRCPETLIDKYQHTLRNISKEQRPPTTLQRWPEISRFPNS